jgi:hypothetical protein
MKLLKISTITVFLLLLSINQSFGQINIPDFADRMQKYVIKNPAELVYLQTDREVYYGGDMLNFKAFIRDLYSLEANSQSKNLHIILVDPFGNLQQEKIFEVIASQSTGTMELLGGLPEGVYNLIAWTNEMEKGPVERVFRKKIFIREKLFPVIFIKLSAGQTTYLPGDIGQVRVELMNSTGNPVKRKKFSYTLSHNGSILESKDGKTDKEGKASLDIAVPDIHELGILVFEIAVNHLGSSTISNIVVPTTKTPVWIEFAPEGGLFVDGLESNIGFKAYDFMGNSVDIEGEVVDTADKIINSIRSDAMGFGSFTALADASNPLKVRINRPSGIDNVFDLPRVQKNGIQLLLKNQNQENLEFVVNTDITDASVSLHAVAATKGELIFDKRFNLDSRSEFSVPLKASKQHRIINVDLLSRSGDVVAHRSVLVPGSDPVILSSQPANPASAGLPVEINISSISSKNIVPPAEFAVSSSDDILSPHWCHVQDIFSWFLLGPSASFADLPAGYLVNPTETELKAINSYLLFHMDEKYDWANIKTGKKTTRFNTNQEFRDKLKDYYQTSEFEKLISHIRANEFFRKHFTESNLDISEYISSNKNELEKFGYLPTRLSNDEKIQMQLQQGKSIMSVLMSIKPYKLMNNKIVFRGNDSYNYQGGAIIVIDGVMRGTDPGILSSISPYDVESIKASANIADIQKYSGLNSTGVVEVTTRKGPRPEEIRQAPLTSHPTIYWDGQLIPDSNASLKIKINEAPIESKLSILIQGIDANGNFLIWNNRN